MRVGIVGYGSLGQFLCQSIQEHNAQASTDPIEIAFVWNRTKGKVPVTLPELDDLADFASRRPTLVVEVSHPGISRDFGERFLGVCDYYMGSPTAMADATLAASLRSLANGTSTPGALYIPVGAFWGAEDISRMADRGTLKGLRVTMEKHPATLKLQPELAAVLEKEQARGSTRIVLYDGPVGGLCPLAPNNVNTMACGAIAGHNLGFEGARALLVADEAHTDKHVIRIEAEGPNGFRVSTERLNPADIGEVTGKQTYVSFFSSLLRARGRGPRGVFFC